MLAQIKLRRGTLAEWTSVNPILAAGEPAYTEDNLPADGQLKFGNGIDHWADIPYVNSGPQGTPGAVGAPGGSDASFAAWVSNAASLTQAALVELLARRVRFPASKYGAVGDGVADDSAALQAAANAATLKGGTVELDKIGGVYKISSEVLFPNNTGLLGIGANAQGAGNIASKIVCASNTACIRLGSYTVYGSGPMCGFFTVDGNGTGDPNGILRIEGSVQRVFKNIGVHNPVGRAVRIVAQNCSFEALDASGGTGDAVTIVGGTGGCYFGRSEWNPGSAGWSCQLTTDGSIPNAYPFGPANNTFDTITMENYQTATFAGLLNLPCGSGNRFVGCGYSNSRPAAIASSGYLISMTSLLFIFYTSASFTDPNFNGGGPKTPIFYGGIATKPLFFGRVQVQLTTAFLTFDSAAHQGTLDCFLDSTADNVFNFLSGGSARFWNKELRTPLMLTVGDPGNEGVPFTIRKPNDAGVRFSIDNTGVMSWLTGVDYVTSNGSLRYSAANQVMQMTGGLAVIGKRLEYPTYIAVPVGSYAIDTTIGDQFLLFGTAGPHALSLSNPSNGQVLKITVFRYGSETWTWPGSIKWINNTGPTLPAAFTFNTYTLRYSVSDLTWHEYAARCENVPA